MIRTTSLWASVTFATIFGSFVFAAPQDGSPPVEGCTVLRMQPLGMLMGCGQRVRALWLKLDDVSRVVRFTPDGVFHFRCAIEPMCSQAVQVDGWIIVGKDWQESKQDADAIVELLQKPPAVRLPGTPARPAQIAPGAKPDCDIFPIELAGMQGRGACYNSPGAEGNTVAVVVTGPELGFALLFRQSSGDSRNLRDEAMKLASRFRLERSEGDIELVKWLR